MNNSTSSSATMGTHILPSDRMISYAADGVVCQFSFPFIVWEREGILVYLSDGAADPSSYSVSGLGSDTGGMVTFLAPPAAGTTVTIVGNTSRERAVDYNDYVTLRAATMNLDANYQEAQVQENTRQLKRALLTPPSDGISEHPMTLPTREERKNSYLAFDGEGNPIPMGDSANLVKGMADVGTTPGAVMTWKDGTGLQADDSFRIFGQPDGAATLNSEGVVPDDQLPPRGTMASQDADSVTITGGTIAGITPLAVTDGGTGADTTSGALTNLGAVPTTRTVNDKALSANITLSNSDIGSEPAITASTATNFWAGDKSWKDFENSVRATLLTGLSTGTSTAIVATDTTIVALGKLQAQITSSGFQNPMTTIGDIIVGGQGGTPTRLAVGSSGQVITSNGTSLAWANNSPYSLPIATTTTLGGIKPDGTTITVNTSTGVASAVGGGGGGSDYWIPSNQYITITYGASGDMYTSPGNGWIYVKCTTSNTNAYIIGEVIVTQETSIGVYGCGQTTYTSGRALYLLFPVATGYNFKMWNSNLTVNIFRFVYGKGAL